MECRQNEFAKPTDRGNQDPKPRTAKRGAISPYPEYEHNFRGCMQKVLHRNIQKLQKHKKICLNVLANRLFRYLGREG